ncbi:MAG: AAA family ATPase, partial [Rhizobacter sp.]
SRLQFTADLMPSDLLGVSVYEREKAAFVFHPGPVFAQVLLADEINRAGPKTQSALLEAMEENQVSIDGVSHALDVRGLERVAIIDFDVHHGNGTEDIIAGDERVLMASIFQDHLYPFSGGTPLGTNMVNVPVPAYTRGTEIRELIEANWMPRLEAFRPQMLFISAGFDAHRDDDLGQLGLVEADYEWITLRLKGLADRHAQGRIVSCLEGGYNLGALARSVAAHLRVLAGV